MTESARQGRVPIPPLGTSGPGGLRDTVVRGGQRGCAKGGPQGVLEGTTTIPGLGSTAFAVTKVELARGCPRAVPAEPQLPGHGQFPAHSASVSR